MRAAVLAIASALLAGCERSDDGTTELIVGAASSLAPALEDIESEFESLHPHIDLRVSSAGSQVIAAQLEAGAPIDVVALADPEALDRVGALVGESSTFATNEIVMVSRSGLEGLTIEDAGSGAYTVILAAPDVPAGRYAREALDRLGIRDRVESANVSHEESVRAVLVKVAMGEADIGFVYATDAASSPKIHTTRFPEHARARNAYVIAIIEARETPLAHDFMSYMTGERARGVLEQHGFGPP